MRDLAATLSGRGSRIRSRRAARERLRERELRRRAGEPHLDHAVPVAACPPRRRGRRRRGPSRGRARRSTRGAARRAPCSATTCAGRPACRRVSSPRSSRHMASLKRTTRLALARSPRVLAACSGDVEQRAREAARVVVGLAHRRRDDVARGGRPRPRSRASSSGSTPMSHPDQRQRCTYASASRHGDAHPELAQALEDRRPRRGATSPACRAG